MQADYIYYYYDGDFYRKHFYKQGVEAKRANKDFNFQDCSLDDISTENLWIQRDYKALLSNKQLEKYAPKCTDDERLKQLSSIFGEINIKRYDREDENGKFFYVPDLGFWKQKS